MARSAESTTGARADFPFLDQDLNGHPLAYLDSGATSQRPRAVLDAERSFLEHDNAAVHRGASSLVGRSTDAFENARLTVSSFVGARENELVWTSNATDALNLVATGLTNGFLDGGVPDALRIGAGDEIVVTEAEHHANLLPWQHLARRTGAILRFIPVRDDGTWTLDDARAVIGEHTRIVAFAHVSNVTGMIAPVAELTALAHEHGALVVLDACQSAPHLPLDVRSLDVDFAAVSAHKMYGPTGIGALYGRGELLDVLPPARSGGSTITRVTMESAELLPSPQRFEAGTQPVSQAVGFAAAADYLTSLGRDEVAAHEHRLGEALVAGVSSLPGIRLVGPPEGVDRAALVSVAVDGVHSHDVGQFLDDRGIVVRVGHHCAQPLHRRLGVTATTRASVGVYSTLDEVERFIDALGDVRAYFGADR